MFTTFVVISVLAAAANSWAAYNDFAKPPWILENMARVGVREPQLVHLGAAKAAGALGLLAGIAIRPLGVAAAAGLVVFFIGAISAHLRVRWYDVRYPAGFLLLAVGALALGIAEL